MGSKASGAQAVLLCQFIRPAHLVAVVALEVKEVSGDGFAQLIGVALKDARMGHIKKPLRGPGAQEIVVNTLMRRSGVGGEPVEAHGGVVCGEGFAGDELQGVAVNTACGSWGGRDGEEVVRNAHGLPGLQVDRRTGKGDSLHIGVTVMLGLFTLAAGTLTVFQIHPCLFGFLHGSVKAGHKSLHVCTEAAILRQQRIAAPGQLGGHTAVNGGIGFNVGPEPVGIGQILCGRGGEII